MVVFELNAEQSLACPAQANVLAINALARDGRLPIVTSANCLQSDGQNDNGWNQGLLFLQSVASLAATAGLCHADVFAGNDMPRVVQAKVEGAKSKLDVASAGSEDGKTLVLRVVNPGDKTEPGRFI